MPHSGAVNIAQPTAIAKALRTRSRKRGSLSPTFPTAIVNYAGSWAVINFILFLLPFIFGSAILKLIPGIFGTANIHDLGVGLPLIAFYVSVLAKSLGKLSLLPSHGLLLTLYS
jgi:hypothetical protein